MKFLKTLSDDGTSIRIARWNEEGTRDVLLVHGLAEHIGRYEHIGQFFAERGWRVTALEFRGHGKSEGKKGHTERWIRYFEDLQSVMSTIGRPMAIVAHSMGGLITLWSMMHPLTPEVRCVALSNPLLGLFTQPPRLKVLLGRVASRLVPSLSIPNDLNTEHISRDPEVVRIYKEDPLIYDTITTRWGSEMLKAIATVFNYAPKYNYPLRLMLGTDDKICDPDSAKQFAAHYGGKIEIIDYEKCYHELFNEPEKFDILEETEQWLRLNFGEEIS